LKNAGRKNNEKEENLIVVLFSIASSLQAGNIKGRIIDGKTGKPLAGANVIVSNTRKGNASDMNGDFKIGSVLFRFFIYPWIFPGKYDVEFHYIGYKLTIIKDVPVRIVRPTKLYMKMEPATFEGEKIFIKYNKKYSNRNYLIKEW